MANGFKVPNGYKISDMVTQIQSIPREHLGAHFSLLSIIVSLSTLLVYVFGEFTANNKKITCYRLFISATF